MKPIQELNPQSLLDALSCKGECPEHEGYSFSAIFEEITRRLSDGYTTSLRKRAEEQQQSAEHRLLVNADLQRKNDALKKSLAQACELLTKANLYVDVCDECKHVDHAVEWMHVNELDADIRTFVEAHQEVK